MTTGNAIAKCLAFRIGRAVAKTPAKLRAPTLTLAAVAAFTTATAIEANGETRLLINCFAPPQHVMCRDILPAWKESVEKATAKRVTIAFPAKSMAPPPAQWESVTKGVFDGALQFNGFIAKQVVGTRVAMSPFVAVSNAEAMSIALWRTYEKFMADKGEYKEVQLLGLFAAPGADFYSVNDTPITSVDSLKGRKMWALPGVTSTLLKELGTPVVSGPAVQMHETVARGVVDGFVGIPASDVVAFKLTSYVKSATVTKRKIFAPAFSFFVSKEKWATIPAEDQKAILSVSGEKFAALAGAAWRKLEDSAAAELKNAGIRFAPASPEFEAALIKASEAFTEGWVKEAAAKGIDGKAALEFYSRTIEQLTAR
jgi:TRAP-type C4-dicarboxylate transport system substrate-binding protein